MLIRLEDVYFDGLIKINKRVQIHTKVDNFSYDFHSGKSYQLASPNENNSWGLCWLIGGMVHQHSGTIRLNGEVDQQLERRKDSWLVRIDEIKRYSLFLQSVKSQIRHGIRQNSKNSMSEADYMRHFRLTPERYDRYLRQFSTEGWRAGCAIGVANGKQIFCFPPIDAQFVEYTDLWFADMIEFLKSLDILVLLPIPPSVNTDKICDEVILID